MSITAEDNNSKQILTPSSTHSQCKPIQVPSAKETLEVELYEIIYRMINEYSDTYARTICEQTIKEVRERLIEKMLRRVRYGRLRGSRLFGVQCRYENSN